MKKFVLILAVVSLINFSECFAKDIPVKIKPEYKITTSSVNLTEGDNVDFIISEDVFLNSKLYLKKGQKISGCVTHLQPNGFLAEPATIYIENFKTNDSGGSPTNLKGVVYKEGNDHHVFTEFFFFETLRGGEVQIKPEKDEFMLYVEEKL